MAKYMGELIIKSPQPKKVISIYCPTCKELQVRNYPYSPANFPPEWLLPKGFPDCVLCQYKKNKKTLNKKK